MEVLLSLHDPMYDFYLLKVTSDGELESKFTDNYEFNALRGQQVLKVHFYLRGTLMIWHLHLMRSTLQLFTLPVCHICGDLTEKKKHFSKLSLRENEEIIASLWFRTILAHFLLNSLLYTSWTQMYKTCHTHKALWVILRFAMIGWIFLIFLFSKQKC